MADEPSNPTETNTPPTGELPAAAVTVAKGITEAEWNALREENARLTREADQAKLTQKKLETDNAHLADTVHQLKQIPKPSPAVKHAETKSLWFFHE